jgi:hypothetical protein
MGGHAKPHTGAADRGKIRRIEIALAEMNEIAARVDRLSPIIIDDKLRAMAVAKRLGRLDFGAEFCVRLILDPQLHKPDATRQEARDPGRAIDDQIERVKHARDR